MYTLRVTVTNLQTERFGDASARQFWADLPVRDGSERVASDYEARLANRFARRLTRLVQDHILGRYSERPASPGDDKSRLISRIVFTLESISYGSLKMDIGIPDIDALYELLGGNIDVLEAIFGAYVPEAFEDSVDVTRDVIQQRFIFQPKLSPELIERLNQKKGEIAKDGQESGVTAKGQRFVAAAVRSAIVLPVLLVFFLWYIARQDIMAERQMLNATLQTITQQQTATLSLLKDALGKATKEPEPRPTTVSAPK